MGKKPSRKPSSTRSAGSQREIAQHPSVRLFYALNDLCTVFMGAHHFQDVDATRATRRELERQLATAFINDELRRGESPWTAQERWDARSAKSGAGEPTPYTEGLIRMLGEGRASCARAQDAIRLGGARSLSQALEPASERRTVEIGATLREADSTLSGLEVCMQIPSAALARQADAMAQVHKTLERYRDEVAAVLTHLGLPTIDKRSGEVSRPTPPRDRTPVGSGKAVSDVIAQCEKLVKQAGGRFPGRNKLADLVGCSRPSVDKAIERSRYLSARKAEAGGGRKARVVPLDLKIAQDVTAKPVRRYGNTDELTQLIAEQRAEERRDERRPKREDR